MSESSRAAGDNPERLIIRTSESGWREKLAAANRDQIPVQLIDDAELGIDSEIRTSEPEWLAKLSRNAERIIESISTISFVFDSTYRESD